MPSVAALRVAAWRPTCLLRGKSDGWFSWLHLDDRGVGRPWIGERFANYIRTGSPAGQNPSRISFATRRRCQAVGVCLPANGPPVKLLMYLDLGVYNWIPRMAHGEKSFGELMAQVRAGDNDAATLLVRHYEPHIRRVVRVRLTSPALKRQIGDTDICQSVLGDFFVRAALGQFDLNSPEQLIKLLAVMTRNKLVNQVEKHRAARRDVRRVEQLDVGELAVAADEETPSRLVAGRELLAVFRARLTEEERYLADARAQGRPWPELAAELGAQVDALRKRLARAIDRVSAELGLETMGDVST